MSVHLHSIKLIQFKNYTQLTFSPSQSINVIYGLNGVGKTNLLDAIYYLGMTRSFFRASDKSAVNHDHTFFRLAGHFKDSSETTKVIIKYTLSERKQLEKNGVKIKKLTDHIGTIPVVMIAPEDMILVEGDHSERRRLINNTISQTDNRYIEHLLVYNRLLRQRNQFLKDSARSNIFDETLLASFDHQMDEPARFIKESRTSFFSKYNPVVFAYYQQISGQKDSAQSRYDPSWQQNRLSSDLTKSRQTDRALQRTSVGPHIDKIRFYLGEHDLKTFGSHGQKKSFILALRLAQYHYIYESTGKAPILLLDDIFDKLDPMRLAQLIDMLISGNFGQILITDTQLDRVGKELRQRNTEFLPFPIT